MPATRKEIEESMMGGRGGQSDTSGVGGRRATVGGSGGGGPSDSASSSAYPVLDDDERGAVSLPMLDSTVHTIYRSPSLGSWMPESDSGGNMSRYSLLPPPSLPITAATASIQQMESAAAMIKLAYRNRLHDRIPLTSERHNSSPAGDVTGGSEGASGWRLPAAAGAEAPAPLRGDPELPRPAGFGLPLADVCEASVARQRAPRDPSSSSDEGLGLDRQPSLTDLRSLDSECGSLAAAMPPPPGRRRPQGPRGPHELPYSGHRIHQSQSPPHHRLDSFRSGRQMSASTTFHGLPGYTERKGAGNKDAPGPPSSPSDGQHHLTVMSAEPSPVGYQMWSNKIVELQQMSDSLTQGIANFIRIAASSDPQYKDAMPPLVPNDRHGSTTESHFSRKTFDGSSSIVTSRTIFSRNSPAVHMERHCDTTNSVRDNCVVSRVSCTVTPADISASADRCEDTSHFERGRVSRTPVSLPCGSYLYQDQGGIRGPPRAGVGDTVDSFVTIAAIPSLRGVGLDANETLKRQSAEVSGDIGGYRPGVMSPTRRQCTGESGDFEPPGPLVNSETTSSVEMGHCSRNCICKEDCPCTARASTEVYPKDLPTVTLFERTDDDVRKFTDSAVGVNFRPTEESISKESHQHDSSSTNETAEDSICWVRGARSEAVISTRISDFMLPDTGLNYTFPPAISGIDEMRAMLMKERDVNTSESLANDNCCLQYYESNGEIESERSQTVAAELKNVEGEHDFKSSDKKVSGCSFTSSRDSSNEPSYGLDQHFLPTTAMSYVDEVRETDTDRGVTKINDGVQGDRNALSSKNVEANLMRNNDTLKKEHISCNKTVSNSPSPSAVTFKTFNEEVPMENICISTCALKTLLSGHGILEDVKEMRKLSTTRPETTEMAPHLKCFRDSTSGNRRFSENAVQSDLEEHMRHDALKIETCRMAERQGTEKDVFAESNTSVRVNMDTSRIGNVADAGLSGTSVTVLATERNVASSEDRSRSATPTEDRRNNEVYHDPAKQGAGDDSASATTSASTSLFGSVVQRAEATAHSADSPGSASNTSSSSELVVPTNSFEDVPSNSRRSPVRYDARETLNLVRELIWKESAYTTLRPEHDTEIPAAPSCQQGSRAAAVDNERKRRAVEQQSERTGITTSPKEPHLHHGLRSGVRTVLQPKPHLRHNQSSQTCVAVREFPNIPATDSLQRTLKTTNLKGTARSPNVSPRTGPAAAWAARLQQKAGAATVRSGPAVPGGWPAVSARPLIRQPTVPGPGLSRSAGSSPRVPCSAYTREPVASRASARDAREVIVNRSKDATAADALLADAASLFRSKLDACDRRQGELRRLQRIRPQSAAPRLSAPAPAGPPTLLRMLRSGPSNGRRQPLQDPDSWQQRQQQLQQRQLQLQQRQQQLQQRQLQLQQRQQIQQRQQLLQRQQRLQQTASWQQRLNQTQVAKPSSRRPPSRSCRSPGAPEALSSACLSDVTSGSCLPESRAVADAAPGSTSLRMLQARLRAGGSLHRGVAADEPPTLLWSHRDDKAPQPDQLGENCHRDAQDHPPEAGDCPTRDDAATSGVRSIGGDLAELDTSHAAPVAVERAQAEEVQNIRETESNDRGEMDESADGKDSTDDTKSCKAPLEAKCEVSYGACDGYSDTSSLLNADLMSVDAHISDLLSEHCTMRFVNYLPSAPVRERDEEDFIREIMLSGQGDVFIGSVDNLLLPSSANETQLSDFSKANDQETVSNVQSEHLIEPPAEFCSDVKDSDEGNSVCFQQLPERDDCPVVSVSPRGLEMTDTGDTDLQVSCSRFSSDSSIDTRGETDTRHNVATTSVGDELAETVDTTSESDTNENSLDDDNIILSHSACSEISSRESSLNLDNERRLESHTERQNDVSEENPLHEDDPMLFCCGLCSIQTTPLTLGETDTGCEFVTESCSPQETVFGEKYSNDVTNDANGETTGCDGSYLMDNSCIMLPIQPSSLGAGDGNSDHDSAVNSYEEQQVNYEVTANGNQRNVADGGRDQNDVDIIAEPSCSTLPIESSLAILCGEATNNDSTANNDVTHEPSIQESTDVAESNELTTEENEDNNTVISSSLTMPFGSLSPTLNSEYTDCGNTTEKSVVCPTEQIGNLTDSETDLDNMVQNTSGSLLEKQSRCSILSEDSSLTLWYTSTDDECAENSTAEPKAIIQEESREMMPCAVDALDHKTDFCLKQDILVDDVQTEKCLTDVAVVGMTNETSRDEENNGNIDTVSLDLQDEECFCDAKDDTISINSLNNDDLTDVSSVSDPFPTVQLFSDSDEDPLTSVVDKATSSRLSEEASPSYVDNCFDQLCVSLVGSQEEYALRVTRYEELHKADIANNAAAEVNGKITSVGTDTKFSSTAPRVPAPESSFTEAHDAQQTQVVDAVHSATSWVTVTTISSSELQVEANISSLTIAGTQNKVGNNQENVGSSSENAEGIRDAAAYESYSMLSSGLPVEENISSLVITGAKNKVENTSHQIENYSDNAERIVEAAADENNTILSSELAAEANILSPVVAGVQNKVEINIQGVESSSDNAERLQDTLTHEISITSSSALLVEALTSYLAIVGAQSIVEQVECSSDDKERIRDAAADESYTTRSSELADEANISSLVVTNAKNTSKMENTALQGESSSDNAERNRDTDESYTIRSSELADEANISSLVVTSAKTTSKMENTAQQGESFSDNAKLNRDTDESYTIRSSELAEESNISSLVITGAKNTSEVENTVQQGESFLDNTERIRDADESYTIRSFELADEANISSLVASDTQNKIGINVEDGESSSDNVERLQDTATHESCITVSSELSTDANISSLAAVAAENNNMLEMLERVESSSDNSERIRYTTPCVSHISENDATSGKQEDGVRAVGSNEEVSEDIALGEPSASWETLSENSCATDEDPTGNARETEVTTHPQQRRRRHRRAARAEVEEEEEELEGRMLDLMLASPEVEVHLSEALSHSENEQPLMPAGPRLAAVGTGGGPDSEVLVAALAGVAMADAEDATDILYGTRDLHSAAVEAAVACVVDSELRELPSFYMQRLGGCLLLAGEEAEQQSPNINQAPMPVDEDAPCRMEEDSSPATPPRPQSTTPPASPPPSAPGLEGTPSSCSLHDRTLTLTAAVGGAAADGTAETPSSHTIATVLTVCLFLVAYSSCLLLEPDMHVP